MLEQAKACCHPVCVCVCMYVCVYVCIHNKRIDAHLFVLGVLGGSSVISDVCVCVCVYTHRFIVMEHNKAALKASYGEPGKPYQHILELMRYDTHTHTHILAHMTCCPCQGCVPGPLGARKQHTHTHIHTHAGHHIRRTAHTNVSLCVCVCARVCVWHVSFFAAWDTKWVTLLLARI